MHPGAPSTHPVTCELPSQRAAIPFVAAGLIGSPKIDLKLASDIHAADIHRKLPLLTTAQRLPRSNPTRYHQ